MSSPHKAASGQGTLDGWITSSASSSKPMPTHAAAQNKQSTSHQTQHHHHHHHHHHSKTSNTSHSAAHSKRRAELKAVAAETRVALPDILRTLPNIHASRSESFFLDRLPALTPAECPRRTRNGRTNLHVIPGDTFNVATRVGISAAPDAGRVAVLNMASHVSPGGGWLNGAMAQEEALCYRSSLALSLHRRYYPWKQRMGIYTPDVVIVRSDMASGHKLSDVADSAYFPVVSAISIAALRCPPLRRVQENTPGGVREREVFAKDADRSLTKDKMRLCLRIAARQGHRNLVLGALGCGAFRNPPEEIARCWLEVLRDAEFQGGWWDGIWFAVFDSKNDGNHDVFMRMLDGVEV